MGRREARGTYVLAAVYARASTEALIEVAAYLAVDRGRPVVVLLWVGPVVRVACC